MTGVKRCLVDRFLAGSSIENVAAEHLTSAPFVEQAIRDALERALQRRRAPSRKRGRR